MKKKLMIFLCLLVLLLALAASPLVPALVNDWWAIGPSSTPLANGTVQLYAVVGQGVTGVLNASGSELCSGYLCAPRWMPMTVYLPLTLR